MIVPSSASLGLATAVSSFLPLEIAAVRPESLHRRVVNKRKKKFRSQLLKQCSQSNVFNKILKMKKLTLMLIRIGM
jgi:hypothetical protein